MADTVVGLIVSVSDQGVDSVDKKLNRLSNSSKRAESATDRLSSSFASLRGVIATLGLASLAKQLVDTASQLQNINLRIERLSGSTEAFRNNQNFLLQTSRELNKDYLTLADSYSKLLVLQDSGLTTQEENRKLLIGMADASAAFGVSNEDLQLSLRGMTQAFSTVRVNAEDYNQVVSSIPGLSARLDAAVKDTGKSFKVLVNEGKVTNTFLKETLLTVFGDLEGAAKGASNTISSQFTNDRLLPTTI